MALSRRTGYPMTKQKSETAWFRHTVSGQVFEAEGRQLAESRKNRDLEEVQPESGEGEVAALRMELEKQGVKFARNAGAARLRELLEQAQEDEEEQTPPPGSADETPPSGGK